MSYLINPYVYAPPLLLDKYPATAAYSLRKLKTGVTNVIKVRRTGDDAELDFTPNEVSDGTLVSWVIAGGGTEDGRVVTWYDQSGNNIHLVHSGTTNQTYIVVSGELVLENGKPGIARGTDTTWMYAPHTFPTGDILTTNVFVGRRYTGSSTVQPMNSITPATSDANDRRYINACIERVNSFAVRYEGGNTIFKSGTGLVQSLFSSWRSAANTAFSARRNGVGLSVTSSSASQNLNIQSNSAFTIFHGGVKNYNASPAGNNVDGMIQESIWWLSDVSSSLPAIESNINNYYNIYPPKPQFIYIVGNRTTINETTKKYDTDGVEITTENWPVDHGAGVQGVAVDWEGNVIVCGTGVSSVSLRKYDSSGTELWNKNANSTTAKVAVDSNNRVISVGLVTSSVTTRKYDSSGTLLFSVNHGAQTRDVATDAFDSFITVGVISSSITTRKYNSANTQQWTRNHGAEVRGVITDSDDNVITGGFRVSNLTTRKYNSAGTLQWSVDHGADVFAVAADSANNIITGGDVTSSITTRKYNSAGTLQWSVNHGDRVYSVIVDVDDNIYTTGTKTGGITTRKYNSSGTLLESWDFGDDDARFMAITKV
jgi:hypothetical protein